MSDKWAGIGIINLSIIVVYSHGTITIMTMIIVTIAIYYAYDHV